MKARLPEGYNMKQGDMMRKVQKMQEDVANAQKEVEETVVDEKGKEKTVKKTVEVANPAAGCSPYMFCFDETAMDFYCGTEHVHHKYGSLLCVLEERGNFFLCFERGMVSCVLKKSELTGGTPDEFRKFMEEKTGKPVEYFK